MLKFGQVKKNIKVTFYSDKVVKDLLHGVFLAYFFVTLTDGNLTNNHQSASNFEKINFKYFARYKQNNLKFLIKFMVFVIGFVKLTKTHRKI